MQQKRVSGIAYSYPYKSHSHPGAFCWIPTTYKWIRNSSISVSFDSYSVELAQMGPAKPLPKKDASLLLHINYREKIVCFVKCNCYVPFTGCISHSKWNNCWNKLMESVLPFAAVQNENTKWGQILLSRVHCVFASRPIWLEDAC